MKNRKLIFYSTVFIVSLFATSLNAQSNKEEIEYFQSIFGMEKKAVVADFIQIEAGDPFWALYDEYENQRKELGKERVDLLWDYVDNYSELDDAMYDEIISSMISLRKSTDKLMDTYYKKIRKSSGSKVAAQFFQIEGYFVSEIRAAIMTEIPYIGEFE